MDSQHGFTLIEMIVVLVVLALIAGIVMSRGPSRSPTLEVKQAVAMVAQAMRGARAAAIAADRPVDVEIDTTQHSIRAGSARPILLPATVAIEPATQIQVRRTAIRFAPDGSSSGGGVLLTEGAARTLVTVDGLTGRVRFTNAQ
ncbi:GspH/FimT family pseudopilin [Acidisphaera sp. S103]|uniref:GspH/FimT family pseudopilin n=1 Tax=Acidisphaera sp. S103 TaxID=1747223 RepID=UPI00131D5EAA|nr:GspH/FimT family pseudopilin [Acidisphaera sp. S103]